MLAVSCSGIFMLSVSCAGIFMLSVPCAGTFMLTLSCTDSVLCWYFYGGLFSVDILQKASSSETDSCLLLSILC